MQISNLRYHHTISAFEELDEGRGSWKKGQPRKFKTSLDVEEIDDIKFIVENLAKQYWPKLLMMKKEMNRRGERLDHVHPLTFFMGVLKPQCYSWFLDLKKRGGLALSKFIEGAVESFHDEAKHGNITKEQIQIFAKITGKNAKIVRDFAASGDWKSFIKWL